MVIVQMFQQSIKNQEKTQKTYVNLTSIKEKFEQENLETEQYENESDKNAYEIDPTIIEQVYSAEWSQRQNAMDKLLEDLNNKTTINEEYAIELFSVLYPNLDDETTPVVKTCVECQIKLLEKSRNVLSFVSYAEIANTLIKQMLPKSNHNVKVLRQKCKELVIYLWNNHHNEGFLSMIIWDNISNNKVDFISGRLNLIDMKLKQLLTDVKNNTIVTEIFDDQIND